MFGILRSRCLTGSALLDCHVLKGFGIYMIGILDSLSDVVEALLANEKGGGTDLTRRWPISSLYSIWRLLGVRSKRK